MNKRHDVPCTELKQFNLRLPKAVYERLYVCAKCSPYTMNAYISQIIEEALEFQKTVPGYLCDEDIHDLYESFMLITKNNG